MPVSYHCLLVFGLVAMTACESDLEKLQRLEDERGIACLSTEIDQRVFMQERHLGGPVAESLGRMWSASKAECELLTREYQSVGR